MQTFCCRTLFKGPCALKASFLGGSSTPPAKKGQSLTVDCYSFTGQWRATTTRILQRNACHWVREGVQGRRPKQQLHKQVIKELRLQGRSSYQIHPNTYTYTRIHHLKSHASHLSCHWLLPRGPPWMMLYVALLEFAACPAGR